jgi:SAM-dependent methyltransferase
VPEPASPASLPIPPPELLQRIGPMGEVDPVHVYEETGRLHRQLIESLLPDDWSWTGKRVLDFGCGVGRMLRQFAPEAEDAELWGCDLDRRSVSWLNANFCPPFHVFDSDDAADLPQEDGFFNLIYAFSVYTHLTDNWAEWLLEHHRVLADDGLLLVTFLGEGMSEALIAEKWDEDQIGMNPLLYGNSWDLGGPIALNSEWWIRAHWGRAFEIVSLQPHGGGDPPQGHGVVLMRKKPGEFSEEDLKRLEPGEPREIAALQHNVEQLRDDTLRLRTAIKAMELRAVAERAQAISDMENSASWRLTAPLRAAKRQVRRLDR